VLGAFAAQRLGLSRSFGVLSGGAVSICGASAALAIASVLPRTRESERDTILTVVTVTVLSTIAMIVYPLFVMAIGLDYVHAGIFLGGTIHDVAQVVGAGYSISSLTGDVATYVKLLRVTMLLPVVFSIAFVVSRGAKGGQRGWKVSVPLFLVGFAVSLVPSHGDRSAGHEDFVQGLGGGRVEAGRPDGAGNLLDRSRYNRCSDVRLAAYACSAEPRGQLLRRGWNMRLPAAGKMPLNCSSFSLDFAHDRTPSPKAVLHDAICV
jgi:Conserved hypothetical protein 698